jgi:hypothetical protein
MMWRMRLGAFWGRKSGGGLAYGLVAGLLGFFALLSENMEPGLAY